MEEQRYWERHGRAFADLYERRTLFNRLFRRALYLRAQMTVDEIKRTPGASVLDVGCGPGRNSVLFVKEAGAARVVGVDLAENMIRMARELAERHGVADRCTFVTGDFMAEDLGGQRFDYSVALGVMDYLRDPVPMLARMRELTGKEAIASFPGLAPARATLRWIRYGLRGCGVHWFWKAEIGRLFRDAGFAGSRIARCTLAGWLAKGAADERG